MITFSHAQAGLSSHSVMVDLKAPKACLNRFRLLLMASLSVFSSVSIVMTNRALLGWYHVQPTHLLVFHFAFGSLVSIFLLICMRPEEERKLVVPWYFVVFSAAMMCLTIGLQNTSLAMNDTGTYQMLKLFAIPLAALIELCRGSLSLSVANVVGVVLVPVGVAALTLETVRFSPAGWIVGLVSTFSGLAQLLTYKAILKRFQSTSLSMHARVGVVAAILVSPFLFVWKFTLISSFTGIVLLLFSCLLGASIQLLSIAITNQFSATTYTILSTAKTMCTVGAGVVLFSEPLTFRTVSGFVTSMLGIYLYHLGKDQPKGEPSPTQSVLLSRALSGVLVAGLLVMSFWSGQYSCGLAPLANSTGSQTLWGDRRFLGGIGIPEHGTISPSKETSGAVRWGVLPPPPMDNRTLSPSNETSGAVRWDVLPPPPMDNWTQLLFPNFSNVFTDFNPPTSVRSDGIRFVMHSSLDSFPWLTPAVNMFVNARKTLGVHNMTFLSHNKDVLDTIRDLGIYGHHTKSWEEGVEPGFLLGPHTWSRGPDALLRMRLVGGAIQRGLGICTMDVDTYMRSDFLLRPGYDIVIQGHMTRGRKSQQCQLGWSSRDFYVNQGFMCMAANNRTTEFTKQWFANARTAFNKKTGGWLQLAHVKSFCDFNFTWTKTLSPGLREGIIVDLGLKVLTFHAPIFLHGKHCGLVKKGVSQTILQRLECKKDYLKAQQGWVLPKWFPSSHEEWAAVRANKTRMREIQTFISS